MNGGSFNASGLDGEPTINVGAVQAQLDQYETLQNADCIDAYAVDFVTNRRTLVLVTANPSHNGNSLLRSHIDAFAAPVSGSQYNPYEWYVTTREILTLQTEQSTGYAVIQTSLIRSRYLLRRNSMNHPLAIHMFPALPQMRNNGLLTATLSSIA